MNASIQFFLLASVSLFKTPNKHNNTISTPKPACTVLSNKQNKENNNYFYANKKYKRNVYDNNNKLMCIDISIALDKHLCSRTKVMNENILF